MDHEAPTYPQLPTPEQFEEWRKTHPPMMGADDTVIEEAPEADQPSDVTDPTTPEVTETGSPESQTPDAETETPDDGDEPFTDLDTEGLTPELAERHAQMQADYTRKTQALAERHAELDQAVTFVSDLVSDEPNATQEAVFRTLAERLGYEFDEDDTPADAEHSDDAETDTRTERERFIDEQMERDKARQETEAKEANEAYLTEQEGVITNGLSELAKADGIELTDEELDILFDSVLALPAHEGGPALKQAYDRYKAATKAHTDRWVKSKKSPQAPGGHQADEPVDFNNEEARLAYTARAVEAAQRAQSGL